MNESVSSRRCPAVSVVLPCRNEAECITAAVTGLLAADPPPGGFEVIIADGMSDDGTREALRRFMDEVNNRSPKHAAPFRLVDNPGRIVSTGLNAAIRTARGEYIVRLDAHTEYAPDYLRECVETLLSTGADNVGGPARTKADTPWGRAIAAAYHSPFAVGGARFHNPDFEGYVDTVTYGCWRKESFEKFGYFDEELVRNQDDEHNLRIIRGGGKIWQNPKIRSWYRPRGTLTALFRQYMQYGYWKVRVIQKHRLPASWRHLVPGTLVLTLLILFLLSVLCSLILVAGPRIPDHRPLLLTFRFMTSGLLAILITIYSAAIVVASLHTAAKSGWKLFWMLPLVFPSYHFGYGCGFLRGFWDFVICRKRPGVWAAGLTRGDASR